jgi:hypothetical protein
MDGELEARAWDFGGHKIYEFLPKVQSVRVHLPSAGPDVVWSSGSYVGRVLPFAKVPRGHKAGENAHHFQHDSAAMRDALPRSERINSLVMCNG